MRFLTGECTNPNCERVGAIWAHPLIGFDDRGNRVLKCESCGSHITIGQAPKVPKKKRTWPYYNESTGVTFESESHEQKYVKENNLTPV